MRSFFVVASSLVLASLTLACSSGSITPPAGNVSGSVSASPLRALAAVARTGNYFSIDGKPSRGLQILISDKANSCTEFHGASSTNLDLRIQGDSVAPGTYAIVDTHVRSPGANEAEADFNAVDKVCKDIVAEAATRGTIKIDAVEIHVAGAGASHVTGSVDATFAGGQVRGDFDAVFCDEGEVPPLPASASDAACPK